MDKSNTNYLLQFFKAAGQPERLKILGLLANQPHSAGELAEKLNLTPKTIAKQLRVLQAAKLITDEAAKSESQYRLNQAKLDRLHTMVAGFSPPPSLAERTLAKYIVDDRLSAIPQNPDERKIILEWFTGKFEQNKRYTENEITEVIRAYYDQPLTLRRMLADNRFLLHTGRHYWRPIPGREF